MRSRNFVVRIAFLAAVVATGCAAIQSGAAPAARGRVVGYYFAPTANRGFPPSRIDGRSLTHIVYAFGDVKADGTVALGTPGLDQANFAELRELKRRHRHLKVLIAFGGWGGSKYFSNAAATQESRARFIESTLNVFLRPYRDVFDGVDLDWEYPTGGGLEGNVARPEDRENLTALVVELRRALEAEERSARKEYLITIAAPAAEAQLRKYEMKRLGELLDFINVMTYDFHAASKTTNYNAPFAAAKDDPTPELNVRASVAAYRAAGVAADKLVVGVPFYGYGYSGVPAQNNGRFQSVQRNGFEDAATAGAKPQYVGSVRFHELKNTTKEGFTRYWDNEARVPWLYNPQTQTWITYDDVQSMREKAEYARRERLGGIMIWELSGDDGTLLPAIVKALR